MVNIFIVILLYWSARILNAYEERLADTPNFNESVFATWPSEWFKPKDQTWSRKYIGGQEKNGRKKWFWVINLPVQILDPWHLIKMLRITNYTIAIIIAIVFCGHYVLSFWEVVAAVISLGITGNLLFTLFYNYILVKK